MNTEISKGIEQSLEQISYLIDNNKIGDILCICPYCKSWQLARHIEDGRFWCPEDGYVLEAKK